MSTVVGPIRFRCFQCNKLLGVARSKAGAVVACPQCSAELIVPEAAEPTESKPNPNPPEPPKSSPSGSRIEPVVVLWDAAPDPDGSSDTAPAFSAVQLEPVSLRPEAAVRTRPTTRPSKTPDRDAGEAVNIAAAMAMPRVVEVSSPAQPVVLPSLTVETPALREEPGPKGRPVRTSAYERSARRDDVVLPRTVLILWSFLVLLALVSAFAAGLFAGRFLLTRGVTVAVRSSRAEIEGRQAGRPPFAANQFASGRETPVASAGVAKYKG